uniref:Secreted protein n=1 Tax=Oryza barthii TaxID=65489 RepID=A0A0D3GYW9_9ORYZ
MVVPYLARAVLATLARAFVPCCPGVWQTLCDVSSFTVRLHRLFGIIYLNDCRDRVTVIVMRSTTPSHASTTTLRHPMRVLRSSYLPNFGYIDHGYSTHGFIDHGSRLLRSSYIDYGTKGYHPY